MDRDPNTEAHAEKLEKSGRAVERSTRELTRSVDRQLVLAADRTLLANERTYAAWVRTALAALASGVGARALLEKVVPLLVAKVAASILIIFAVFCLIAAVWRHLRRAVPPPPTDVEPLPRVMLVPMNAFLLLVAIAVLVGIWAS